MAKKAKGPKGRAWLDDAWAADLRHVIDRNPDRISRASIVEATGQSRTTVYRVLYNKSPTIKAVDAVLAYVRKVLPEASIAPPFWAVRDLEDYQWCALGRRLRELRGVEFDRVLEAVRQKVGAAEAEREADAALDITPPDPA